MSPDQQSGTERVEWRVLLLDGGHPSADLYEGARNLAHAKRLLAEATEHWSKPVIQKRTVVESPWEDVSGDA
jgi:hypothetical protein